MEEDAAASVGINVTRSKLFVTLISAAMTSGRRAVRVQYQLYINLIGLQYHISLQYLGSTAAACFVTYWTHGRRRSRPGRWPRLALGDAFKQFPALDLAIYGLMLVLFTMYMSKGILGAALEWRAPPRYASRSSTLIERASISNSRPSIGGRQECKQRRYRRAARRDHRKLAHGIHLHRACASKREPAQVPRMRASIMSRTHTTLFGKPWTMSSEKRLPSGHSPLPATTKSRALRAAGTV